MSSILQTFQQQQSKHLQSKTQKSVFQTKTSTKFISSQQMMQQSFSYLLPNQKLKSIKITQSDIIGYVKGKKIRKVYQNCEYDQLEMRQIQQFRVFAQGKLDVNIKDIPDKTILRYLYSLNFNQKQALQKLNIYIQWCNNPQIQRIDNITLQLMNQGVCYTYGRDKDMRPIIFLNVAILDMAKYTLQDYLSVINAVINLVIDKLYIKGKIQNYLFIIDTQNKNFSSLPLSVVKQMVLKLSYVYCMRMGKLLIINCNYLVKLIYSAISPFLEDVTKQKTNMLSYSEVEAGKIKQFVDIDQLQQKYGGFRENLVAKWPPQIPDKHKKSNDKQVCSLQLEQMDKQSVYYSCQNDQQAFLNDGQNVVVMEDCCVTEQCVIF